MRQPDDIPGDERIMASLEAVDATLAGEPVDPIHAELAELALLLADERPGVDPEFATRLDRAVQRRFAPVEVAKPSRQARVLPALRRGWWFWTPAAGLAAALIAAVVIVAAGPPSSSSSSLNGTSSGVGHAAASIPSPGLTPGAPRRT